MTGQVDDFLASLTSSDFLPTMPGTSASTSAAALALIDRLSPDERDEVHQLVMSGHKMHAIKTLRTATGCNLQEANDIVKHLTTQPLAPGPTQPAGLAPIGERRRPNGQIYKPRHIGPHEDLALLRAAQQARSPVLLYGPPGTGKTAMVEAAFAASDGPGLETVLGSADTTEMDLLGTFVQDPATRTYLWAPGPLHRSVLRDVPLLVDEIALIDPRVLSVLYALMDGRGVLHIPANPQLAPLPVGKNWSVIGACNPHVPGANLSDALLDRFDHHILVESDWELARELGVPTDIVKIAKNLDLKRRKGEITWSPQLRSLLSYRDLAARLGADYAAANLVSKAPEHDRDEIMTALKTRFPKIAALSVGARYGS
jgi:hypothetical protein